MAAMQQQPLSKTTPPPLSQLPGSRSLEGKVVIVTGGTSGLGRCIAIACARAGARGVLVTGRDEARGAEVCNKINREGGKAAFVAVDLTDGVAAVTKIMVRCCAEFGMVDCLVNSAAACFPRGDLETTTPELWDEMMATNVKAPCGSASKLVAAMAFRPVRLRRRDDSLRTGSCSRKRSRGT